jgi:hypothetical protein
VLTYERERHELIVVNWYIQELAAKPVEFANLFAKPLRNLTEILYWCSRTVKLFFELDTSGIWIASWVEPTMNGAYWSLWVREDKRQGKGMLAHVNQSLDLALVHFQVLMAVSKQPRLQSEMERLGWIREGQIPHLFDGDPASVYWMDKESRNGAGRKNQFRHDEHIESLRRHSGGNGQTDVVDGEAGGADVLVAGGGSAPNGRRKRADTKHKRLGKRVARSRKPDPTATPATAGGRRPRGHAVR